MQIITRKRMVFLCVSLSLCVFLISIWWILTPKEYISVTATDLNQKNHYVFYDIRSSTYQEILTNPDTAQYPLGFYMESLDQQYFVKRMTHADNIYAYTPSNQVSKALTTSLYSVNDINVYRGKLYLLACFKGEREMRVMSMDPQSGQLNVLSPKGLLVKSMSIQRSTSSLYFVGYGLLEQFKLNDESEKNNAKVFKNVPSQLYKVNLREGTTQKLFESEEVIDQIAVMNHSNQAIIKSSADVNTPYHYNWLNLDTFAITENELTKGFVRIDDMGFSSDDQHLYFLGDHKSTQYDPNDVSQIAPPNALYDYSFQKKTVVPILAFENQFINNFEVVSPE